MSTRSTNSTVVLGNLARNRWLAAILAASGFGLVAGQPVHGQAEASTRTRQILREIIDPGSGARWLLLKDVSLPGGPGRLVLADLQPKRGSKGDKRGLSAVVHTGDRVIVEEHSAKVDAWIEAVALGPAVIGGRIKVRLVSGGNVIEALVVSAGRVHFLRDGERW